MADTGEQDGPITAGEGIGGSMASGNLLGMAYVVVRGDDSRLASDLAGSARKAKSALDTAIPAQIIAPEVDTRAFSRAGSILKEGFTVEGIAAGAATMGAGFLAAQAPIELVNKALETFREDAAEAKRAAYEFQQAGILLDAMLESTEHGAGLSSEALRDLAKETSDNSQLTQTSLIQFENGLLRFQNIHTDVFKRATKTAADWNASGKDMGTIAFVLGRALNDPTRAAMMLRRAQIQLSLAQQDSIDKFMRQGQVAKAQGVILDAIDAKYKGLAESTLTARKRLETQVEESLVRYGDLLNKTKPLELRAKIVRVEFQRGALDEVMDIARSMGLLDDQGKPNKTAEWLAAQAGRGAVRALPYITPGPVGDMIGKTQRQSDVNNAYDWLTGMKAAREANDKLDQKLAAAKSARDAKAQEKAYEDLGKIRSEKYEGFSDPLTFAKKMQEALLENDKTDRMIGLLQLSNKIQGELLDEARKGRGTPAIPVATP
jgi:hypothetical protein